MDPRKKREPENVFANFGYFKFKGMAPTFPGLAIRYKKFFCFKIYKTMTQFVR